MPRCVYITVVDFFKFPLASILLRDSNGHCALYSQLGLSFLFGFLVVFYVSWTHEIRSHWHPCLFDVPRPMVLPQRVGLLQGETEISEGFSHWHLCRLGVPKPMVLPQGMACSNERPMLEKASLRGNDIKTTYRSQWYYRITRLIPMRDRHGKNVISAVAIRDDCTEVDDTTIKYSVVQREADVREGFSHW